MVKSGTHACAGCGCNVPQKVGVPGRVRRRCEKCRLGDRKSKADDAVCATCGAIVHHTPGRGTTRKYCSNECVKNAEAIRRAGVQCSCVKCGKNFCGLRGKKYCSDQCRWSFRCGTEKNCEYCGKSFKASRESSMFCSRSCRNFSRARLYECLNCGVGFRRKRFAAGGYSSQSKYCSRDCAFEARRLKKKCAERPLEVANKLATWFLSWGDDQWPLTSVCQPCGRSFVSQRNAASPAHVVCGCCRDAAQRASMKKHKQCPDCGGELKKGRWLCDPCAATRCRENRRKNKRASRRRHGNASTFRQRCKKYGAPYTKVCKEAVMIRGKWKCQLCGVKLLGSFTTIVGTRTPHPRSPTIDHIVPLSFGPSSPGHVLDNCQAACWQCNWQRGVEDADSFARRKATQ
jgi:hypothetical protein